jgi:hypothetical protein
MRMEIFMEDVNIICEAMLEDWASPAASFHDRARDCSTRMQCI